MELFPLPLGNVEPDALLINKHFIFFLLLVSGLGWREMRASFSAVIPLAAFITSLSWLGNLLLLSSSEWLKV